MDNLWKKLNSDNIEMVLHNSFTKKYVAISVSGGALVIDDWEGFKSMFPEHCIDVQDATVFPEFYT